MPKVFISYSSKDEEIGTDLFSLLLFHPHSNNTSYSVLVNHEFHELR